MMTSQLPKVPGWVGKVAQVLSVLNVYEPVYAI